MSMCGAQVTLLRTLKHSPRIRVWNITKNAYSTKVNCENEKTDERIKVINIFHLNRLNTNQLDLYW